MKQVEDELCAIEAELIGLERQLDQQAQQIDLSGYDERIKKICTAIENHVFIEQPVGLLSRLEALLLELDRLEEKITSHHEAS